MVMHEVFKGEPADPGLVFYTITREDVGREVIDTTAGIIFLRESIQRVLDIHVGLRIYRVPASTLTAGATGWIWKAESDEGHAARLAEARNLRGIQIGDNNSQTNTFN
jgi:hypothetical protein